MVKSFSIKGSFPISHVVSTKFMVVVTFLSSHCVTLNHPVTISIMVTDYGIKGYSPLLHFFVRAY